MWRMSKEPVCTGRTSNCGDHGVAPSEYFMARCLRSTEDRCIIWSEDREDGYFTKTRLTHLNFLIDFAINSCKSSFIKLALSSAVPACFCSWRWENWSIVTGTLRTKLTSLARFIFEFQARVWQREPETLSFASLSFALVKCKLCLATALLCFVSLPRCKSDEGLFQSLKLSPSSTFAAVCSLICNPLSPPIIHLQMR